MERINSENDAEEILDSAQLLNVDSRVSIFILLCAAFVEFFNLRTRLHESKRAYWIECAMRCGIAVRIPSAAI